MNYVKIDLLVCGYLAISEIFCYAYCTMGIEAKQEIPITTRMLYSCHDITAGGVARPARVLLDVERK